METYDIQIYPSVFFVVQDTAYLLPDDQRSLEGVKDFMDGKFKDAEK